jgi:hypothetical protein
MENAKMAEAVTIIILVTQVVTLALAVAFGGEL